MPEYYGQPVGVLENPFLRIEYLHKHGPRLVRLVVGTENLLAETPSTRWETRWGTYHLWGGHRLWTAPETDGWSDIPDNTPPQILVQGARQCRLRQQDPHLQIQKEIDLQLEEDAAGVRLLHTLTNQGPKPLTLSAWPITQFGLGGVVYLPQADEPLDPAGVGPNRNLVFWSYTAWQDPRLRLLPGVVLFNTTAGEARFKVGSLNHAGWLAYHYKEHLFVKYFAPAQEYAYPDFGCSVEIYANEAFVELETLSPLQTLDPGESLSHREVWKITPMPRGANYAEIQAQIAAGFER